MCLCTLRPYPWHQVEDGVRLESVTLMQDVRVHSHALIKDSLVGGSSSIGKWCFVSAAVLGENVAVNDSLLVNGATVLPNKELTHNVRSPEIII